MPTLFNPSSTQTTSARTARSLSSTRSARADTTARSPTLPVRCALCIPGAVLHAPPDTLTRPSPRFPRAGYAYAPDPKVPAKLKVHFSVAPVDAPCTLVWAGPRLECHSRRRVRASDNRRIGGLTPVLLVTIYLRRLGCGRRPPHHHQRPRVRPLLRLGRRHRQLQGGRGPRDAPGRCRFWLCSAGL